MINKVKKGNIDLTGIIISHKKREYLKNLGINALDLIIILAVVYFLIRIIW